MQNSSADVTIAATGSLIKRKYRNTIWKECQGKILHGLSYFQHCKKHAMNTEEYVLMQRMKDKASGWMDGMILPLHKKIALTGERIISTL